MESLSGVEVIIGDSRKPPVCPHGPTLLFRRTVDGVERLFYACSACRDRKGCQFFLWANEEMEESKKVMWDLEKQRILPKIQHTKLYLKLMKLLQSSSHRTYCHSCNELLFYNEIAKHTKHDLATDLSDYQLTHPSELLKPLENAKKEAQYLFSKKATETIVSALKNLGCKHVLCIGAPRIHEYILSECSTHMDSLLLDIDHRYHQFYGPLHYCWYNVFNNYYFNQETGTQIVDDFLQQDLGSDFIIIIDPPFGGRVEPLANTIQLISKQHQVLNPHSGDKLKVMWIFPYFMEVHVLSSLPDYHMLDYKVDYDNHPLFSQGPKSRKFGSPVRIFTNVLPEKIPLPEVEGYRYCKPCKRWVSQENKHCQKCSSCTSKDGRTYVHCSRCKRCVKPSWSHCNKCDRCCQQSHKCGAFKPSYHCYSCGELGHKKVNCLSNTTKATLSKHTREAVTMKRKLSKSTFEERTKKQKMNQVPLKKKGNKVKASFKRRKKVQV